MSKHKQHTISAQQARTMITDLVAQKGSQRQVALDLQISESYLSDILDGARPISDAVAKKLGYNKVVVYQRIPDNYFAYQHNPALPDE